MRLDDVGVCFTPSRLQRLRGERAKSVPFAAITGVSMTEPKGLTRGKLTLRLRRAGEELSVTFRSSELEEMRLLQAELWRRSRPARDG